MCVCVHMCLCMTEKLVLFSIWVSQSEYGSKAFCFASTQIQLGFYYYSLLLTIDIEIVNSTVLFSSGLGGGRRLNWPILLLCGLSSYLEHLLDVQFCTIQSMGIPLLYSYSLSYRSLRVEIRVAFQVGRNSHATQHTDSEALWSCLYIESGGGFAVKKKITIASFPVVSIY